MAHGPPRTRATAAKQERAYLVAVDARRGRGAAGAMPAEESLDELAALAEAAGAVVVGRTLQHREHPDPASYLGGGKLTEVRAAREELDYTLVLVDDPLSPAQQLRLERELDVKVLDRSALILDIFASRARSHEAALQVELAQHRYLLPRLRGQWEHLERLEGAIGARGPGETQLETDRRLIGGRIARLQRRLESVRRQRALHRRRRARQGIPVVALVGYANAGKSSLLRALAGAEVLVADQPFATLDPTTRRVGAAGPGIPPGLAFLLTDTVGFMQKLPAQLISAFRATLEELESADLLLHVLDVTSPTAEAQARTVEQILAELGLGALPRLVALNKADGLRPPPDEEGAPGPPVASAAELAALSVANPAARPADADDAADGGSAVAPPIGAVLTSATRGWGIDALRERLSYELFGGVEAAAPAEEPFAGEPVVVGAASEG